MGAHFLKSSTHKDLFLELCCFEWFQLTLKATHFLSSFFLIQVYILVVKTPFPCREVRLRVLRTTLPLPVSD